MFFFYRIEIQALLKEKKLPKKVTYNRLAPSHSIIKVGTNEGIIPCD